MRPKADLPDALKGQPIRGFTLVELLVAVVLAVLLMGGLLGVLRAISRSDKASRRHAPHQEWTDRFLSQMEWDLTNSRTFRCTQCGFELAGYAARDFASGSPLHQKAVIEYTVLRAGSKDCLFRRETHLESNDLDNAHSELVAVGIDRIRIAPADPSSTKLAKAKADQRPSNDDSPLPDQVAVWLYGSGQNEPLLSRVFTVR